MIKWKTKSGITFYQDNKTNTLYDANMNQLSKPNPYEDEPIPFTSVHRSNHPTEIKIVLGHDCNYSCGYCVQRDVGDHARKVKHFDPQILIAKMRETLNLSDLDQLELWGGETLLYWDEIIALMKEFDAPHMDFVIPTNGSILNTDHINFFLGLKGRTTIELSHDGPDHAAIRGREYLPQIVDVLRLIEQNPDKIRAELSVTITNQSFDLFALNDFFREYFKKNFLIPLPVMFRPVWAYNALSESFALDAVLPEYEATLRAYLDAQIGQFKELKKVASDQMLESQLFHITINTDENSGVLQRAANFKTAWKYHPSTICGMHQSNHLTIDNMGNLRACQNTSGKDFLGNILDFKTHQTLPVKGLSVKNVDKCQSCPVYLNCLSGCPLDMNEHLFETNCKIAMVHEITMLKKALEIIWNEPVEMV